MKLSDTEKRDLEKFVKFLAIKASQIIVQSRMGERVCTACDPSVQKIESFNLSIQELPDVLAEVKKLLMCDTITTDSPFYVEISLETPEGDVMVLEYWCLGLLPQKCDPTERILSTIYSRIGILLKSLVSITRVTPAYKLSRRQGYESYIICYKIHIGEPPVQNLGEGHRHKTVAQVCTPIGTIQLSVAYRTKMTISPTHTKENSIMVKSDHFDSKENIKNSSRHESRDSKPQIIIGAFADPSKSTLIETDQIPEPAIFEKFKKMTEARQKEIKEKKERQEREEQEKQRLKQQEEEEKSMIAENELSSLTTCSTHDDFLLVEMKTPFAAVNRYSEIQDFYKKIKAVPPLTFGDSPNTTDESLSQLLEECEGEMNKYDEVMKSLQLSPDNF